MIVKKAFSGIIIILLSVLTTGCGELKSEQEDVQSLTYSTNTMKGKRGKEVLSDLEDSFGKFHSIRAVNALVSKANSEIQLNHIYDFVNVVES